MTAEELLEAIGQVDDDLIQEAEAYRLPARKPRFSYWKPLAGGLAACLVLAALFHLPSGMLSGGSSGATAGSQAESSAAADSSAGGGSSPQEPESQDEPAGGNASSGSDSSWDFVSSETLLCTPDRTYTLTGEIISALPEDSRQLGVLFLEGEDSASHLYTSRKEYAGCMLWQGPDGTLYVQIPGGGYAVGQAAE